MPPSWQLAAAAGAILESGGLPLAFGFRSLGFAAVQEPRARHLGSLRTFLTANPLTEFQEASGPLSSRASRSGCWQHPLRLCGASFRGPNGPEASSFKRPESPALPLSPYLRLPGEIQGAQLNLHFTETTNSFFSTPRNRRIFQRNFVP